MDRNAPIGLILLAAGGSSRLGRSKQLLDYHGKPLIRHAAEAALASRCRPVVVVLGKDAEACAAALHGLPVRLVVNGAWKEGLASSIRVGIAALEGEQPGIFCGMFCVADQPHLTAALLDSLIQKQHRTGAKMVAAEYDGKTGVPALFCASLFEKLKALQGDEGARHLLRENPGAVARVPFHFGAVDIDTPADYEQLRKRPGA